MPDCASCHVLARARRLRLRASGSGGSVGSIIGRDPDMVAAARAGVGGLGAFVALAVSAALIVGLARPVEAQVIRGRIFEDSTRNGVEGTTLSLLRESGEPTGRQVRSDSAGTFSISTPGAGRFVIVAQRVGFHEMTTPSIVTLAAGEVVVVELFLGRRAAPLTPITIMERREARPNPLQEGFEERRRTGMGTFLTREDIERRKARMVYDLLLGVPGVELRERGGGRIAMSRATGSVSCQPLIYLDGVRANRSTDPASMVQSLLKAIPADHVEGVEIYKGRSQLPAEFGSADARCGAVVLWTRHPGAARPSGGGEPPLR